MPQGITGQERVNTINMHGATTKITSLCLLYMPRRTYALHLGTDSALTTLKTANILHTECTFTFTSTSI